MSIYPDGMSLADAHAGLRGGLTPEEMITAHLAGAFCYSWVQARLHGVSANAATAVKTAGASLLVAQEVCRLGSTDPAAEAIWVLTEGHNPWRYISARAAGATADEISDAVRDLNLSWYASARATGASHVEATELADLEIVGEELDRYGEWRDSGATHVVALASMRCPSVD